MSLFMKGGTSLLLVLRSVMAVVAIVNPWKSNDYWKLYVQDNSSRHILAALVDIGTIIEATKLQIGSDS